MVVDPFGNGSEAESSVFLDSEVNTDYNMTIVTLRSLNHFVIRITDFSLSITHLMD